MNGGTCLLDESDATHLTAKGIGKEILNSNNQGNSSKSMTDTSLLTDFNIDYTTSMPLDLDISSHEHHKNSDCYDLFSPCQTDSDEPNVDMSSKKDDGLYKVDEKDIESENNYLANGICQEERNIIDDCNDEDVDNMIDEDEESFIIEYYDSDADPIIKGDSLRGLYNTNDDEYCQFEPFEMTDLEENFQCMMHDSEVVEFKDPSPTKRSAELISNVEQQENVASPEILRGSSPLMHAERSQERFRNMLSDNLLRNMLSDNLQIQETLESCYQESILDDRDLTLYNYHNFNDKSQIEEKRQGHKLLAARADIERGKLKILEKESTLKELSTNQRIENKRNKRLSKKPEKYSLSIDSNELDLEDDEREKFEESVEESEFDVNECSDESSDSDSESGDHSEIENNDPLERDKYNVKSSQNKNSTDSKKKSIFGTELCNKLMGDSINDNLEVSNDSIAVSSKMFSIPEQKIFRSDVSGNNYYSAHFCIFCKTFYDRLDRHLTFEHSAEPKVAAFIEMPKGSVARRRAIGDIRKQGDSFFNKNRIINPKGIILGVRREQDPKKKKERRENQRKFTNVKGRKRLSDSKRLSDIADDIPNTEIKNYSQDEAEDSSNSSDSMNKDDGADSTTTVILPSRKRLREDIINEALNNVDQSKPDEKENDRKKIKLLRVECPTCHGYYCPGNLRNHMRLMHGDYSDMNHHQIMTESRKAMKLCHPQATVLVQTKIFPKLNLDSIGVAARFDLVCVLFANKFSIKYNGVDQQAYLRGNVRLLGKLLLTIKRIDPTVPGLAEVFVPKKWPVVHEAINQVCEFDGVDRFSVVYNAETLPMLIRKCIKILKNEYIMKEKEREYKKLEKFEKVFEDESECKISYLANLSRKEKYRNTSGKSVPTFEDTCTFENYLEAKRQVSILKFENGLGNEVHYQNIVQTTAGLLLIYNRRRNGEISRVRVLDFINRKKADPNDDFFKELNVEDQAQRLKYCRINFQGKRFDGEGVMYASEKNTKVLQFIVKCRTQFGIHPDNPFLFAIKNGPNGEHNHINLFMTISTLSKECSLKYKEIDHENMRATGLRKQLASANATVKNQVDREILARHMGHSTTTHNKTYRKNIDGEDVAVTQYLDVVSKFGAHKVAEPRNEIMSANDNNTSLQTSEATDLTDSEEATCVLPMMQFGKGEKNNEIQGKRKNNSWSAKELKALNEAFELEIANKSYPSNSRIRKMQAEKMYAVLKIRSPDQIKAKLQHIYNQKTGATYSRKNKYNSRQKKLAFSDSE